MANELSDAPVETAPATQTPATAPAAADNPSASSVVETPSLSPSEALAEAEADFRRFYDPPAAEAVSEEKTEEQAQTPAPGETTEQPKGDKPAEVKTPTDEPPEAETPTQIRPRLSDPKDLAIAAIARAEKCTFAEAAEKYFAATKPAATIPGVETEKQAPEAKPSRAQELQSQIDTLVADVQADRESDDHMLPAHSEKLEKLADLRMELKLAKFQESQEATARQRDEAQNTSRAVAASFDAARAEFPSVASEDAPLRLMVATVENEWAASPATVARLSRPDAPQMLVREAAERVAGELVNAGKFRTIDLALASLKAASVAPVAPKAPAPLSSPAAAQQPPVQRRVTPAPGSKGQQNGGQPSTFGEVFASVETAEQGNEALLHMYGGPTQGHRRGS